MFEQMEDAFGVEGYDQMEVFAEREATAVCNVSNNSVDASEENESVGVGVRVLVDNRIGFAYTSRGDKVRETARKAVKLAEVSQSVLMSLPIEGSFPKVSGLYDRETARTGPEDIVEKMDDAVTATEGQFSSGRAARTRGETYLMNSNGVSVSQEGTFFSCMFSANRHGRSKYWFDAKRSLFDPALVAEKAQELVADYKDPVKATEGRRDIVLSPYALYQIFSGLLYPAFDADRVQRGNSVLAGKQGDRVASDSMSIVDNGRLDGGLYSRPFDREGTPGSETVLVDDGVLQTYLYDLQRAERAGIESTGNASGGYNSTPSIRPRNMVLSGERGSEAEAEGALLIHDVSGVHTANETSGDFSLNITTAFELGSGGKTPVEGGLLVGNLFDLLENHRFFYGDRRTVDSLTTAFAVFGDQKVVTGGR